MVFVYVELSTQKLYIYVVVNAVCINKIFSKNSCICELLARSFVYIKLSITKTLCIYELLAIVIVYVELSTQNTAYL